ncbi:MAG: hypothetical protein K0U72_14105 [Gammaproteobacteria bacterium]|nr:hypothetical protein [Gammaproteobacteria bacterium]
MLEIAIIAYVLLSLVATIVVVRSGHLERGQLIYQSLGIWLIPFLGALVVVVFHSVVHTNMTTKAKPWRGSVNSDDPLASDLHTDLD